MTVWRLFRRFVWWFGRTFVGIKVIDTDGYTWAVVEVPWWHPSVSAGMHGTLAGVPMVITEVEFARGRMRVEASDSPEKT